MRLVYKNTGREVRLADVIDISRGEGRVEHVRVRHFAPPHKPSSSGKVTVETLFGKNDADDARSSTMEYYVGVIGAEWIEREDREPKKLFNVHVRLADQIEACDEQEAFDKMLDVLEGRSGFEIMGHDIIEEENKA